MRQSPARGFDTRDLRDAPHPGILSWTALNTSRKRDAQGDRASTTGGWLRPVSEPTPRARER